jgi:hypothetical protein
MKQDIIDEQCRTVFVMSFAVPVKCHVIFVAGSGENPMHGCRKACATAVLSAHCILFWKRGLEIHVGKNICVSRSLPVILLFCTLKVCRCTMAAQLVGIVPEQATNQSVGVENQYQVKLRLPRLFLAIATNV